MKDAPEKTGNIMVRPEVRSLLHEQCLGIWMMRTEKLCSRGVFEGLSFMFGSFSPVEPRKADVVNSCHALQISHQRHSRGIHGGERPWRSHRPGAAARRPSHHGHGDSLNDIKT